MADVIAASDCHSIGSVTTDTESFLFTSFWSGNVLYEVCIGSAPRGLLIPKRVLELVSCFYSLFETVPSCVAVKDFSEKLSSSLPCVMPALKKPSKVNTFGPTELESCLSLPSSQILDRYDFRSILDYLLLKLRSGLDNDWLQNLPVLHKVYFMFISFHSPFISFSFSFSGLCLISFSTHIHICLLISVCQ